MHCSPYAGILYANVSVWSTSNIHLSSFFLGCIAPEKGGKI
uniref:Uncharacterized protein n=1 Tax=Anguilla anguilla TaxID=7936 RepID=A0A0E9UIY2_ANGAN